MGQKFACGFLESVVAEIGGVTLRQLHFDPAAIVQAYRALRPLAERLGIDAPKPHLAGFGYPHVAALGCEIVFLENSEPKPLPLVKTPEDIDRLREPGDYLAAPVIQRKLAALRALQALTPEAAGGGIGHIFEGPVTTAVLLMGENFFVLPYDDPARAHALLKFATATAIRYAAAIHRELFAADRRPGPIWMPDDFAGMFPPPLFREFVVPYWEMYYTGMRATTRHLHSELLRADHLPFLKTLGIASYDPTVNPYLTPEFLAANCHCPFDTHIHAWEIHDFTAERLEALYRRYAACRPAVIAFYQDRLADEPKIRHLLQVARSLA
jgi:uroporphyrinogen-III decarboxylase